MAIEVKVRGADKASAALRRMDAQLGRPQQPLDRSALRVRNDLQSKLRGGKDYRGRRLRRIKDSTRERRQRGGFASEPPLRRTGRMINSLRHVTRVGGRRSEAHIRPNTRQMKKIAAIHQERFHWAGVSDQNKKRIDTEFTSFARNVITRNGGAP